MAGMSNYYLYDFLEIIDNEKKYRRVMDTSCMSRDML
jgi:hypothetical protein